MNYDVERINVLFHNRAGEAMLSMYREFTYSTSSIDRRRDENVFQQQQSKYTGQLRQRLGNIAVELMQQLEPGANRNECNHVLGGFIQQYIHEFGQKIRAL